MVTAIKILWLILSAMSTHALLIALQERGKTIVDKLIGQFDDVLDWSPVHKATLVLKIMIIVK